METIISKKEELQTKKKPKDSKFTNHFESHDNADELSDQEIKVQIDDTVNSIIMKKFENRVKESPLKKGKSSVPSEHWIG